MPGGLPINTAPISIALSQDSNHNRYEMVERNGASNGIGRESESGLDLNDHRMQPASLPRLNSDLSRPGRGTLASIYADKPEMLQAESAGPVARDSEIAVTDDERSIHSPDGPVTPMGRKPTFSRRKMTQSRSSSRSSSTSPPGSVHAFAVRSHRRRRAGTAVSIKPPSINSLHRTISGDTHRRRPTFSEKDDDARTTEQDMPAEDDVCFPSSDEEEEESIDYEDLEEFVEENEPERSVAEAVPKITTEAPTPERKQSTQLALSDEDLSELEKHRHPEKRPESAASRRGSQVETTRRLWTFFSSDFDDAIHSTTIGGLLEPGQTFQDLFELKETGCYWLDGLNPTEDEVTALCKAFGVHRLTKEDVNTQEAREKVEIFKKYYFVSFRSFNQDRDSEEFLEPVNVYAVVFRNGLLTFSFAPKNPHTGSVLKRIGNLRDHMQLSSDWICYAIIDDIVDHFNPFVHDVEQEVDAIEDQVFISRPEDARNVLHSISECRKKVMSILRLLGTKSDVIKGFAKRCNEGFEAAPRGDVGLYLSDIQDHVLTMRDNLTHSEQLLSRVHNNYLAQLNVDHISSGNRVNKVLSKITLLASILVPLNLVTGLFGMNVPVPGRNSGNLGWFFGIVGFLVTFSVVSVIIARRMRFI